METLVLWFALAGLQADPAPRQPSLPILEVPAASSMLSISVPVPGEARLSGNERWVLVEPGERAPPVPAELLDSPNDTGVGPRTALVSVIPPRANASGLRRFQLLKANPAEEPAGSGFRFGEVDENSIGLWEGSRPVFVYNHGMISRPGVPADRIRSTYLHPIYGLDGEVLTDDFPKDHYHHRGLFWAWPHVRIEGKNYDLWDLRGIQQRFERWLCQSAGASGAILGVENGWYVGENKVAQERIWFTTYPASQDSRLIDVDCAWTPVSQRITLAGAEDKSYGGLTLRFAPRKDTLITTPLGVKAEDLAMARLAWADLTAQFGGAPSPSGAAIFIAPDHPDFPPTWLTRHYGALCVGWPGVEGATFMPGQQIRCGYRMLIHRGRSTQDELSRAFGAFATGKRVGWLKAAEAP